MKEKILKIAGQRVSESGHDREQFWIKVPFDMIAGVIRELKESADTSFDMLTDLCGVDLLPLKEPRFQVIYHMLSSKSRFRLRIKTDVPDATMTVPTITGVFKGADWMEREAYDMYGINFSGHPDMRRILMHEDFVDFPQRKDFPLKGWREEED